MEKFAQTFKDLCEENNINIKNLSKKINVSDSLLYKYANQKVIPTVDNLVKLANYFNCSVDYLIGDDNSTVNFKMINYNKTIFYKRFLHLLQRDNIKISYLKEKLQIPKSTVYDWKKGTMPYLDNLIKIAKYFDVSIDYLIGRSDD